MTTRRAPRPVQRLAQLTAAAMILGLVIAIQAIDWWLLLIIAAILFAIVIGGQLWKF